MRKFLVVLDNSQECLNAMRFAAMRAAHTGGGVEVLAVIEPEEFNHWIGVGDIMREEARDRINAHFEVFAKWMRDRQGVDPELVIREGEPVQENPSPGQRGRRNRRFSAGRWDRQQRPRAFGDSVDKKLWLAADPNYHRARQPIQRTA